MFPPFLAGLKPLAFILKPFFPPGRKEAKVRTEPFIVFIYP
jgi:hypothetical protein